MIIYTMSGCASCRKAKAWLKDNHIEFIEKNLYTALLDHEEMEKLLDLHKNKRSQLISFNSKLAHSFQNKMETLNKEEWIEWIQKNPSLLKRPIYCTDTELANQERLDHVINEACAPACASYALCQKVRKDEKEPE